MRKTKHTDNEYSIKEAYRYLANAKETIYKILLKIEKNLQYERKQ